ncbi:hypothetical protein ABT095_19925 [Kitasatospora sp. NPDC002227]|uniref:hypothetical protein n=1 Tax=Kitasatospora sp. NPDC002227 TaxID=3154773 RepID=UPI00332956B2
MSENVRMHAPGLWVPGHGVAVVVVAHDGQILLHKPFAARGRTQRWSILWDGMEIGENPLKAAARMLHRHDLGTVELSDLTAAAYLDDAPLATPTVAVFSVPWTASRSNVKMAGTAASLFVDPEDIYELDVSNESLLALKAYQASLQIPEAPKRRLTDLLAVSPVWFSNDRNHDVGEEARQKAEWSRELRDLLNRQDWLGQILADKANAASRRLLTAASSLPAETTVGEPTFRDLLGRRPGRARRPG